MDAIETAFGKKERNSEVMRAFGFRLRNQFSINEAYRRPKELQWLEDLRAYKGIYDPDVKIDPNASKVYPKITRSKVNIVLSRLHEMLFPETDKNWEIMPTPEPKVSPATVNQIVTGMMQDAMKEIQAAEMQQPTGQPIQPQMPTSADVNLAIKKYADDTCAAMSSVIDDQLTEMDYPEETKLVLRSGLMYGTGVMKGPMINKRSKHIWAPDDRGEFVESQEQEEVPFFENVRIWDWYPDMSVTDMKMIEGSFQRHLMTKHDLRTLLKREDYYADIIKRYLEDHPGGDYVPKNWEIDLQTIEVQAGAGKNAHSVGSASTTETASVFNSNAGSRTTNRLMGKKYEVLDYWGYVDGQDLEACGLNIPDPTLEYACNVWLLGNVPIKAVLFDGALDQYKVFYYEKDETSLFGEGLARVMRHSQLAIAASARMVLDNGACVAGPQVEVNWSLLTPDTDINSFYARKIWYREGRGIEAQYPAIRALNFDSHIDELLKIVDAFKQFGDEETTLPTWMIGQMVNNETAQATSGRMATITISIKDVVKNFDAFTEKIIRDLYAWNMEFNPRSDIKGDYNVKARGVSSLVMKEIRMQALTQLTTTMTPEEWVYVPRREFIVEKFKAHDINIKILTEEEADKIRQDEENSQMHQLQIQLMESEIAKNKAQAMSNLTKAKEKNVLAEKEAMTPPETPPGDNPELRAEEVAGARTDNVSKEAEIRRQEEAHALELQHKQEDHDQRMAEGGQKMVHEHEKHAVGVATEVTKAAQDLDIKEKQTEHGMKMKEQAAKAKKSEKKPKPAGGK
jgi:hypothetical protein